MPLGSLTRWRPGDSSSWRSRHEVLREQLIAGDRTSRSPPPIGPSRRAASPRPDRC